MAKSEPVICRECGAVMNFHAEKVDYGAVEDPDAIDPEFGGRLDEVHACPTCGAVDVRPSPRPESAREG